MAEIQGRVIEQAKRNAISRHLHAKNDKEKIAAWKSDLNRILQVFNVRSIISVWLLPTPRSQMELAINTHVAVSKIHNGVVNMHDIVSGLEHNVTSAHVMVSDIHRTIVGGQEGSDGASPSVSDTRTLPIAEWSLTVVQTQTRSET